MDLLGVVASQLHADDAAVTADAEREWLQGVADGAEGAPEGRLCRLPAACLPAGGRWRRAVLL